MLQYHLKNPMLNNRLPLTWALSNQTDKHGAMRAHAILTHRRLVGAAAPSLLFAFASQVSSARTSSLQLESVETSPACKRSES